MAPYVLSCCSTVDLTRNLLESRSIEYVYFNYHLDGASLKDDFGETNSPEELYRKMLDGADCKTSQVSAGDYITHFEKFLAAGQDVLHVTLSSGISGTYNSACAARDELAAKYPDRKLVIVDSLCASAGYGMLVDRLADLRDEGMGFDELCTWAEKHKLEVQHWFFSSDLTFFVRGGRISKTAGAVAGALKICPVMDVEPDGSLAVKEKIRTKARAIKRDLALMEELAHGGLDYSGKVFISQSVCEPDAQKLAHEIESKFTKIDGKVQIFPIGATIGVHTGPGTVALFFWGKPRA